MFIPQYHLQNHKWTPGGPKGPKESGIYKKYVVLYLQKNNYKIMAYNDGKND